MRRRRRVSVFGVLMLSLVAWSAMGTAALSSSAHASVEAGDDHGNETSSGQVNAGLASGHPVDQILGPTEAHSYETSLAAGQYLRLAVTPQGVDVVVMVFAPDGHQILKKRSPYGPQSPVDACIVATSAGTYKTAVTATDDNAHSGRYQIRITELRKATPRDLNRAAAEEPLAQAQESRERGTMESRRLAINEYGQALSLLKKASDRLAEAQSLEQMGGLHNDLGNNKKAVDLVRQSLRMFQSVHDRRGEGLATSDLGSIENDLGNNKEALVQLTMALAIRREVGDRRGEAETLEYIGTVFENTSEFERALDKYNAALFLRRGVGDRFGEAQSLDDIGVVYQDLDEEQKALDCFRQALPIQQSLHDLWGEALTLHNFGVSYDNLGEKKKALDYFSQTLPLKRALGNRRGEANSLSNMCGTESTLGEWQSAIDHCNAAVAINREIGDRDGEASTLTRMGLLYVTLGERKKGLNQFELALTLSRATENRLWQATILTNIGLVFHESGRFHQALAKYNLALPIRIAVGDRTGEAATLNNIGRTYDAQGKKSIALNYFSRAFDVASAAASPRWQAGALSNMARLYAAQGQQRKALDDFNQALSLYRSMGDQRGEASVLYGIARVEGDLGDSTTALAQIESALKVVETLRGKVTNQQLRASYFSSVSEYYEFYIDLLMQLDKINPSKGYAALALGVSERSRARSLLETLQEARADIRHGIDPALLEREHSLQQVLDGKTERQMRLLAGRHTEKQAAEIKKEIEELLAEYQEVQAQIRTTSPRYAALTQPLPFDLVAIQKEVLDKDTVLLEYSLGNQRSYLWAVTTDSLATFELPRAAEVEAAARRVYQLLTARNLGERGESDQRRRARLKRAGLEYPEAALALSKIVLEPAAKLIPGKRLAIVADGALHYVPFGVLPLPNDEDNGTRANPLVINYSVVNLPSASVLGLARRELADRKLALKAVAVLADPVFDREDPRVKIRRRNLIRHDAEEAKTETRSWTAWLAASRLTRSATEVGLRRADSHLPRLVFTRHEAKSILALTPAEQGMEALDFKASRSTATSVQMSQYQMIHFATHGSLDSEHPELSGLVLSLVDEQGRPVNGFLGLEDVYNLSLSAELVTLSACETALGTEVKGEGLVGLTRGFMYAGAPRVVASLWKVDDVATAELMVRFYKGILQEGLQPSQALRWAQVQMQKQKRWADPYYWGSFTIQGEWR